MSSSIGEQLRAARETRAWSVEEVAGRLKVPVRYVAALESGDAAGLPEPTFVRGYIKAYAKAVGLDGDVLLMSAVPLEVKAPRPLIGPEGHVQSSRRNNSPARAPSFRGSASRRYPLIAGILVLLGGGTWYFSSVPSATPPEAAVLEAPSEPKVSTGTQVVVVPPAGGAVTLDVPLPGVAPPAVSSSHPGPALPQPPRQPAPAAVTVAASVQQAVAVTTPVAGAQAAAVADAAPVTPAQRKGLHARFDGTCWVEVRDADNVVIHTRIAMAGNELNVDGKAPLTVTLGDASAAELWYNGERVTADRFSSNGIARIIVGQTSR